MDKLEIKATLSVSDAGEIVGNAWPFGSADSVGDIITKGANLGWRNKEGTFIPNFSVGAPAMSTTPVDPIAHPGPDRADGQPLLPQQLLEVGLARHAVALDPLGQLLGDLGVLDHDLLALGLLQLQPRVDQAGTAARAREAALRVNERAGRRSARGRQARRQARNPEAWAVVGVALRAARRPARLQVIRIVSRGLDAARLLQSSRLAFGWHRWPTNGGPI